MTDWARLDHAYGTAEDVPALLAAAEGDEADEVWQELFGRLCHQGTVYSASYAALPHLASMAARRAPAGYVEPLHLAAAIIASSDTPGDPAEIVEVRARYAVELATLRDLARHNLVLAEGPTEFVYGLQSLLAFENQPVWQRRLDALADGELEVGCPGCRQQLYLSLTAPAYFATTAPDDHAAPRTPLVPVDPLDLDAVGSRLHKIAFDHGQPAVAQQCTYLFGRATCPVCGTRFVVSDAVATEDAGDRDARGDDVDDAVADL